MIKQLLKIFVVAITFIVMNTSLYSIPWGLLGNFVDTKTLSVGQEGWIYVDYYQFGQIIWGFGDGIIYLYGEEDLPNYGKRHIENFEKNKKVSSDEDIYVYVYKADAIVNPIPTQHKIVKGDIGFDLQNLNLNLEKGKLYIVVFRDKSGVVLNVKKIMKSE